MKLTLGFSPCPNDTFIFDALVNRKIDTEGLEFEPILEDVETLNRWAFESKFDVTKLSFPSFFQNLSKYILLNSGSALGKGVGPLLISKSLIDSEKIEIKNKTIALPGKNTTANLLFSLAFPETTKKRFMIFSAIEDAVLNEETDMGVIIHENRFTYPLKGLKKVMDLGEYWEEKMKLPIPLGGIGVKRTIDKLTSLKVDKLIRKSLDLAFENYPIITDYVKQHSQEMSEDVMRQHINLYVNNFSLNLGEEGKGAIRSLFNVYGELHSLPHRSPEDLFL
ncbi:MAG: 1,4-dihydroxy-6-naphthoate synthase [Chitinophagaceae bacterium]